MARTSQKNANKSGFGAKQEKNESPFITTNPEFDQERQIIEDLKNKESETVLTPQQFQQSRARVALQEKTAGKADGFAFKAGRDPVTRKRYFNVKGFADPKQIYRCAVFVSDKTRYYFFSENYDKLYMSNSDKILTVNAWVKVGKNWELQPIAKNQLNNVQTIPLDEARSIYDEIQSQGKNPGA